MDNPPAARHDATEPTDSTATTEAMSEPTVLLPQARTGQTASDRRQRGIVVAGGVAFAVLVGLVATTLFSDGDAGQNAAAPVTVAPATDGTPELTTEPSASSTPTAPAPSSTKPAPSSTKPAPPPSAPQRPRQSPAQLITGIRGGLPHLVSDGQLDKDAAKDLDKRLEDTSRALADGDTDKAWDKLRETAEKTSKLRKDGKLTDAGYQALAAALNQLAQAFPPR
ncbi:FIMAH domain-containing protein [Micromonospora sp. SL1-18]|uniref:FIMAH domain-containing protein n=1 Tax=Micromonospora sp. SL1-18 TaxID=3399128 RepID=UPI003A4D6F42